MMLSVLFNKYRAKSFVRHTADTQTEHKDDQAAHDRHIGTDTQEQTDSPDSLRAGIDSDSANRRQKAWKSQEA